MKHIIKCHTYWFEKIENTNNDVRTTQDIPKSATEVTYDFAKWLGFQVPCNEEKNGQVTCKIKMQVT